MQKYISYYILVSLLRMFACYIFCVRLSLLSKSLQKCTPGWGLLHSLTSGKCAKIVSYLIHTDRSPKKCCSFLAIGLLSVWKFPKKCYFFFGYWTYIGLDFYRYGLGIRVFFHFFVLRLQPTELNGISKNSRRTCLFCF